GMQKDAGLYASLLRAIGQHANASSIEVLADDLWGVQDHGVIQARILSLGRIRTVTSAETLLGLMKAAGPNKIQPFMEDFRLALLSITGVDQGASQDLWLRWWNDKKSKLKVPETPPQLPKAMQARWDSYWGGKMYKDRQPRRGERGKDDPEKGAAKG